MVMYNELKAFGNITKRCACLCLITEELLHSLKKGKMAACFHN
jgi:hypothetical protein